MTRERKSDAELGEKRARLRRGLAAELIAAGLLMAKGYRILARRRRTPYGEIDILAVRGSRVAFVEVKRRKSLDEAHAALTSGQGQRIGNAAEWWIGRHRRYRDHEMGLDAILVVPRRWPQHLPNVLDT